MKISVNGNSELREKISNMTPKEMKKSGICKSTSWHIRKNFSQGKTPKNHGKVLLKIQ